jgi:hypothetical protein
MKIVEVHLSQYSIPYVKLNGKNRVVDAVMKIMYGLRAGRKGKRFGIRIRMPALIGHLDILILGCECQWKEDKACSHISMTNFTQRMP